MHVLIFVLKTLDALSPQWQYSELLSRAALAVVIADGRVLQARGGALLSVCHRSLTKGHCCPPGTDEGTRPPMAKRLAQATQLVPAKGFLQGGDGVTFTSSVTRSFSPCVTMGPCVTTGSSWE